MTVPIMRLIPEPARDLEAVRKAVEGLQSLQSDVQKGGFEPLTDEEILSAVREGRKY